MAFQTLVDFSILVYHRAVDLLIAPARNVEMIWLVIPLTIVTLLMTFYFGRYSYEDLGWNTAVGNSLVLMFVSIDLLRYLFNLSDPGSIANYFVNSTRTLVVLAVAAEGLLLMYTNYLHFIPKRVAFIISSPLPVNLTAYTVMAIVYTEVPIEWITLWAAIAIFIALLILLSTLKGLIHWQAERVQSIRKEEVKAARIKKKVEKELQKPNHKVKKK